MKRLRTLSAAALCLLSLGAGAQVASANTADTNSTSGGTVNGGSGIDFELPQRWNDAYKPGTHCATPGENGAYMVATRHWFHQTDASGVANRNDEAIPVKQTVSEARTQTTTASATAKATGDLAKYLNNQYGFSYTYEEHWKFDQIVGPYQLPAHRQGTLVWGFSVLDSTNQDVHCNDQQVWQPVGSQYTSSVPESRYAELRLEEAPVYN